MRSWSSGSEASSRAILKASSAKTWIFLSTMIFWNAGGISCQTFSGEVWSLCSTNTPPSLRPASALVWWKTLGSGESTTSTKKYSQLTRIGSGATDR